MLAKAIRTQTLGNQMTQKYPGRVPVIVNDPQNIVLAVGDRKKHKKFLIPENYTPQQFMCVIRRQMQVSSASAIFLTVNGMSIPPPGKTFGMLYAEHRDHLDLLRVAIRHENVFG